ncbi:Selenocysteine-specific elongation factor [Fundidesulfovibrio magnetotacticus]|uniref:Selenocysteine-specific elongation factor n=1 Tax=Fundidesulfovibrio magnetotacticus TaxID=2730080 RepID=A0A6V8LLI5_9BACT|nr:selenocysteine-specific translation elongation factor [Fundidesulfovibrio magnetotacticus]GFK93522.1 Selenocysteine-specific elongation factor [Fundidesulfovibrio magnetotacticus]
MALILGTAGHIDHGKTTLVKALTGTDCDRLAEEKKRGITIELGFAFLELPGVRLGVVDVPGHERFVKNMVAGAAGIDFVVLVIAADEGVMPQTREHLEICTLLGIRHGVVALTKVDMVDEDWLGLVTEDVRAFLAGSFLAEAPMVPVSAHTGQGLDELRAELARLAAEFPGKRRSDLARLPIDRVFTMKGHGTVVTGTLISGRLRTGDDVLLYPSMRPTKVRSLQVHGLPAEEGQAGQRTAVNVMGLEVDDVERGEVLAHPGTLFPSLAWNLEVTCLASSPRALKHRGEVHFHHGTREVMARLYFLDRDKLEPGQTALCQARFESPLAGVSGDRCVMRSFSPLRTVAGATILSPLGGRIKRNGPELADLAALPEASAEELTRLHLKLRGREGASFPALMTLTGLESRELERVLQAFSGKGQACLYDREARMWLSGEVLESLAAGLLEHVAAYHRREPLKQGVSRGELASAWGRELPPKLVHFLVERLLKAGKLSQDQESLRLPGHSVSLGAGQADLRERLLALYEAGGITPPNYKDVLETLGASAKEALPVYKLLSEQNLVRRINEDLYFAVSALDGLKAKVAEYFATHADLGPQDFRELTGLTRKFAIPLLEFLDKEKVTVRVGDKRLPRVRQG